MDPKSGEVVLAEITENSKGDAQVAEDMMNSVPQSVQNIYGDGAYDSIGLRRKIHSRGAKPKIPPPRNAAVNREASDEAALERNHAIQAIKGLGGDDSARSLWKKLTGYHRRSLVETTMFRYKQIFGGLLRSRSWANQKIEAILKCQILNRMTRLGMPVGVWEAIEVGG